MQISPKAAGKPGILKRQYLVIFFVIAFCLTGFYIYQAFGSVNLFHRNSNELPASITDTTVNKDSLQRAVLRQAVLVTVKYDQLNNALSNGDSSGRWPVKLQYPLPGAVFPFSRVIAAL